MILTLCFIQKYISRPASFGRVASRPLDSFMAYLGRFYTKNLLSYYINSYYMKKNIKILKSKNLNL